MYLLLCGVLLVLFLIYDYRKRHVAGLPGPTPYPIVGTVPKFLANIHDVLGFHQKCIKQYGDTYLFSSLGLFRPDRGVFTSNPENVRYILKTNFENYNRHTNQERMRRLFGTGIFVSNGERWKVHRRTARPLFSKTSLADMMPHFLVNAQVVLDILQKAAETKQEIDIQDMLFRYTLDSFALIGFGHPINSLLSPVPFSEAFNRAQDTVVKNGRNPFVRYLPDKQFDEDIETLRGFVGNIIKQRQDNQDYHQRTDLLSRFMSLKNEETGHAYTDEELKDAVLNFFIAGRDTTACLMTWTLYLLSQHTDVEEKLVAVLNKQVKGDPSVEVFKTQELSYLQNVVDETLRLYPPVPFDFRRCEKDDVWPDGRHIQAGMFTVYSAYWLGRSEKYWGKDAGKFNPERWKSLDKATKAAFVPFHQGPQTCLGRSMAYLEAKTLLTIILKNYKLRLAPGFEVVPKPSIVLTAKNGLKVTVEARK